MKVVDQYNDPAFGVLADRISRMPSLEAFVKTAEIDVQEAASLPTSAFAWPEERRFPIHTPEHAALSLAYVKVAMDVPRYVSETIMDAVNVYGIPDDVFAETKVAGLAEPTEDDYLLPDLKRLPVRSAEEVKFAQDRLLSSLTRLDLEHRAMACGNLVKKADEYGVQLHPEVLKLAGFVVSSTKVAREWLEARANALPDREKLHKLAYQTLADELKKQPVEVRDRNGLLKLANAIGTLDEQTGLDRHYDHKLPDALRTVFNTNKLASATVDLGGALVPVAKLASLPASFWDDLGGAELVNEVAPGGVVDTSKLATVVETLPLDLKLILKSQLGV